MVLLGSIFVPPYMYACSRWPTLFYALGVQVLGAAMFHVQSGGESVLYTGDFNMVRLREDIPLM